MWIKYRESLLFSLIFYHLRSSGIHILWAYNSRSPLEGNSKKAAPPEGGTAA